MLYRYNNHIKYNDELLYSTTHLMRIPTYIVIFLLSKTNGTNNTIIFNTDKWNIGFLNRPPK